MNYSEVKELLQAGFTADEIRTMLTTPADNPQNPQDNPQETVELVYDESIAEEYKKEQEEKKLNQQEDDTKFNQLNATMEKLIKTIQSSNLNNSSFDKMNETDIDTKVDQIMSGLIRPEREKGGSDK